ncbi:MAG: DUF3592 domain-containing protein [Anaerolineae bacterium]|nr:DUF3592 domain-containing protein [Anaerolineae bacterium]
MYIENDHSVLDGESCNLYPPLHLYLIDPDPRGDNSLLSTTGSTQTLSLHRRHRSPINPSKHWKNVIVRNEAGLRLEKKHQYRCEIEFKTLDGKSVRFTPHITTRPASYQMGETVPVLYDPKQPKSALINSRLHLWFSSGMLIFFGFFFIGMGVLGVLLA